jgi:hypothetical protein
MYYIQRKDSNYLETVDETEKRKDARYLLNEYMVSDYSAEYYISTRCCQNWKE